MRPILIAYLSLSCPVPAQDAPGYLGDGSAVFPEADIRTDWNVAPPNLLWHRRIGAGATGFAISGKHVIVAGNDGTHDVWWCIDSDHGTPFWQFAYKEEPRADRYAAGPVATAAIDGDRVHVLSKSGKLHCLSLDTGKALWTVHLMEELGGEPPAGGFTMSPVVHGNSVLLAAGTTETSLVALDRTTGEITARSPSFGDSAGATPRIIGHRESKAAVLVLADQVVAISLGGNWGERLFGTGWTSPVDPHRNNPQWSEAGLFLPAGDHSGFGFFKVSGNSLETVHRSDGSAFQFHSAVPVGADFAGVGKSPGGGNSLARIDPRTGEIRWREPLPGTGGTCVLAGPHLVVLCDSGEMLVGTPGETAFEEHARITVLKGPCRAPLSFAGNRIYARSDQGTVLCMAVSPHRRDTVPDTGEMAAEP